MSRNLVTEVLKDAPIPAVPALAFCGFPLEQWVVILTAVWAAVRVVQVAFELYWKWKDRREQTRK